MSNATQILLGTKSNLEIANLNFVTPKRFGRLGPVRSGRSACRYIRNVSLWVSQSHLGISTEKTTNQHTT